MIKITMELEGRKYELVPDGSIKGVCMQCAFRADNGDCKMEWVNMAWNRQSVCGKLNGIWKEVKDDTTTN